MKDQKPSKESLVKMEQNMRGRRVMKEIQLVGGKKLKTLKISTTIVLMRFQDPYSGTSHCISKLQR